MGAPHTITRFLLFALLFVLLPCSGESIAAARAFVIEVTDEETGRGVPLVELTTTAAQTWITDSNGIAAIDDLSLLDREVFFLVSSHGYTLSKDGFGIAGKKLKISSGKRASIKIRRAQIAERLYRITGAGIYAHSIKAGVDAPIAEPLLDAGVAGCDSVQPMIYMGKIHWFWGDTNRLQYPLGNFHMTGATSALPGTEGFLPPERGVNFDYFEDGMGFVRPMCKMPGEGPTWLSGLAVLPDKKGRRRMAGTYVKIKNFLEVYERGLSVWNDERLEFELFRKLPLDAPAYPDGHSFVHKPEDKKGQAFRYFGDPYPFLRMPDSFEAWSDPSTYEVFTSLDRTRNRFGWKQGGDVPAWSIEAQRKSGLTPGWIQLEDAATRKNIVAHRGTVNWNAFRKRWIMIATQAGGSSSYLGEVWYAESDKPEGPWKKAVKIATHSGYSFYNPRHHSFFDQDDGRVIYFEGTYTTLFSKTKQKTPLYDYNQIMYRLDLSDKRLRPAQD